MRAGTHHYKTGDELDTAQSSQSTKELSRLYITKQLGPPTFMRVLACLSTIGIKLGRFLCNYCQEIHLWKPHCGEQRAFCFCIFRKSLEILLRRYQHPPTHAHCGYSLDVSTVRIFISPRNLLEKIHKNVT